MYDLIIRGGTIFDGNGGAPHEGDVVIDDGRIERVAGRGEYAGEAREEIDARGRIVTPGFVDVHTHYEVRSPGTPTCNLQTSTA